MAKSNILSLNKFFLESNRYHKISKEWAIANKDIISDYDNAYEYFFNDDFENEIKIQREENEWLSEASRKW